MFLEFSDNKMNSLLMDFCMDFAFNWGKFEIVHRRDRKGR